MIVPIHDGAFSPRYRRQWSYVSPGARQRPTGRRCTSWAHLRHKGIVVDAKVTHASISTESGKQLTLSWHTSRDARDPRRV